MERASPQEATRTTIAIVRTRLRICVRDAALRCPGQLLPSTGPYLEERISSLGALPLTIGRGYSICPINQCNANAESMMGDKGADIIRPHYAEMTKLVDRLRDWPVACPSLGPG